MKTIDEIENLKPFLNYFIQFYYKELDNSAGGLYHICLDDGNLEPDHIWYCQQECEKENDTFGIFLGLLLRSFTTEELKEMYNKDWWGMKK
jgi:hypothetical protein